MAKLAYYALQVLFLVTLSHVSNLSYSQPESGSPAGEPVLGKCYCYIPDPLRINTGMKSIAYQGKTTAAKCGLICKTGSWCSNSDKAPLEW